MQRVFGVQRGQQVELAAFAQHHALHGQAHLYLAAQQVGDRGRCRCRGRSGGCGRGGLGHIGRWRGEPPGRDGAGGGGRHEAGEEPPA
ncbi:hypothetical protein FQZ97_1114720 [compost metagenome]